MGQSWLNGLLAGVMIVTTVYCVSRLVISRAQHRPAEHDVDGVHALMGISMAGMLVAGLRILPAGVWAAVFGAAGVWFAWRIGRTYLTSTGHVDGWASAYRHHHVPHLVMCGGMVYMLLGGSSAMAAASDTGMEMGSGMGMSGSHFTVLALLFTVFFGGYAVWETDRIGGMPRVRALGPSPQRVEAALAAARSGVATSGAGVSGAGTDKAAPEGAAESSAVQDLPVSPRLAACCQIAMAATMAYMLVLML